MTISHKRPYRYTLKGFMETNKLSSLSAARKHSQRQVVLYAIRDFDGEFTSHTIAEHIRSLPFTDELRDCGPSALSKSRWAVTGKVSHLLRWHKAHGYIQKNNSRFYQKTGKAKNHV
jgi:hypothetical protein